MKTKSRYAYYWWMARALPHVLSARLTGRTCFGFEQMKPFFEGRTGLEFGGPSTIFSAKRLIPIYQISRRIDQSNFSTRTIWDAKSPAPKELHLSEPCIEAEAANPSCIKDGSYEFVLASHVLEHVANPLRALMEWKRILQPEGVVLVVLPHKAGTFDHRRPFSTLSHIEQDYQNNVTETDLTHLPEILELHDLAMDPGAGTAEQFRERCLSNASIRAMHHHVFCPDVLVQMFDSVGMAVLNVAVERPYHIIVLAQVMAQATTSPTRTRMINADVLRADAAWRKQAAFSSETN